MSLTINDATMTSDQSPHTARQVPGHRHGWEVTWLPGQVLDRDTAITAMILADIAATGDIQAPVTGCGPPSRAGPPKSASPDPTPSAKPPSRPPPPASPSHPAPSPDGWSRTWTGRPPTDQPQTPGRTPTARHPRYRTAATAPSVRPSREACGPRPTCPDPLPPDGLLPDLALYEHLIADGLAAADARRRPVDHVTARRLAIWLAARPQPSPFARALVTFTQHRRHHP